MSQFSETSGPGEPNLRRALQTLPTHEPDADTWAHIEAQLPADDALAHALATLPTHEPEADLWDAIATRLPTAAPQAPPVGRPMWPARPKYRALALAASLLLLLGVGWWQLRPAVPARAVARETLTFSEEAGELPTLVPGAATDPLEAQGLSFIDSHCSLQPAVCQSGEFRSLRTQLRELESQEAQLHRDARRFGSSPELRREQARLVALKAAFTRQLVHLLIS